MSDPINNEVLYLIYDGDCLLCHRTAYAIRLRASVKRWELINARDAHPLVEMLKAGVLVEE